MKTERRHELRTNELSQQIDHVGDYVKQNAAVLTAVVIVAAAIVGGVFWYVKQQQNTVATAWATLSDRTGTADASQRLDSYQGVANQNLDPVVTVRAWINVGETAMMELFKSKKAEAVAAGEKNYAQIAEDAYSKVRSLASKDPGPLGQAIMGLGLLAERRGDMNRAKQCYQEITEGSLFADSPLKRQAAYRIENMGKWSTPVIFPPPPPPASQPVTSAPAFGPAPGGLPLGAERVSPGEVPEAVRKAAMEARNKATTQPAGN